MAEEVTRLALRSQEPKIILHGSGNHLTVISFMVQTGRSVTLTVIRERDL